MGPGHQLHHQPTDAARFLDLNRGSRTRFTFDPADDLDPVWSPDGGQVAWTSDRKGVRDLYVKSASGSGQDEPLLVSSLPKKTEDWSKDGGYLIFNQAVEGGPMFSIFALPVGPGAERTPFPVRATEFSERRCQLSPNSKFLAYTSNESGRRPEVYVQSPFRPPAADGRCRHPVDPRPIWRADGKELYYVSGNKLLAASVKTDGASFEAGFPRVLFEARFATGDCGIDTWPRAPFSGEHAGGTNRALLHQCSGELAGLGREVAPDRTGN